MKYNSASLKSLYKMTWHITYWTQDIWGKIGKINVDDTMHYHVHTMAVISDNKRQNSVV